ncbi:SDR family oxidoreductase [Mucilaginibacter sp.]
MNITQKTILITGGGSGIGFAIAKLLSEKDNQIIITGRTEAKLKDAVAKLNNVSYFVADVTKEADVNKLVNYLAEKHPTLDVIINNAGQASVYNLANAPAYDNSVAEFATNYFAPVRLIDKLLPTLKTKKEAAIINVTSVLAIAPSYDLPTYSASKFALRAYTQALRFSLKDVNPNVKVFELMPPLVDTEFSAEIGGSNGIPPAQVAEEFVRAVENDQYEIRVGFTAQFWDSFLKSPEEAFLMLNSRR